MQTLITHLVSLNKKNVTAFLTRYNLGKRNVTLKQIKELYLIVIEDYFTGKISFDECVALAGELWWLLIDLLENGRKRSKFSQPQFKTKDEETLFWRLHFTNEGTFANYYFLTQKNSVMNPGIKLFMTNLRDHYWTYSSELERKDMLSQGFFKQTFEDFDQKQIHAKSDSSLDQIVMSYASDKGNLILPFEVTKVKKQLKPIDELGLKKLFVAICQEHDKQRISIDSISATACCILEVKRTVNQAFHVVLLESTKLAFLERFSATSEDIYAELAKAGQRIHDFVVEG